MRIRLSRRAGAALAVLAAGALRCTAGASGPEIPCVSRFDCASDETCEEGACVLARGTTPEQGSDAGTVTHPAPDAGTDPGLPDSGTFHTPSPADGGITTLDSGTLACGAPISVTGFGAFCSIGEAVQAAPQGSTVVIPPGRYLEAVQVTKALTLEGNGAVSIVGSGGGAALRIDAAGVFVKTLSVDGNGSTGVEINANAFLQDVTVTAAVGAGIWVSGPGTMATLMRVIVTRVRCAGMCTTADYGEGLVAHSGTSVVLTDSELSNNDYTGIWADNSSVRLTNTILRGNGRTLCRQNPDLCYPGLAAQNSASIIIEQASQLRESGGSGVQIAAGSSLSMRNSSSRNNGIRPEAFGDGVHLDGTSATLDTNDLTGNTDFGIGCVNTNVHVARCSSNIVDPNGLGSYNTACGGC